MFCVHRLFSAFSPATRWSRPVVGAALTAGLVLSAGAKQPLQNAEAAAEHFEQSATSSRDTSSRATLSSGKEGGRYELTPERRALLNTIRYAEGTWKDGEDKGYRIMYGGGQFQDLSRHPERVIVKRYTSAAAGAYQFLPKTWKGVAKELKLSSFEPRHQDQAALHLVDRRGALKEIDRKGLTRNAMAKLAPEWASFPTWTGRSAYGQPVKSPQDLASFYSSNLRQLRNQLGA
ncbi:lysozyme [Synechococcus sp. RS9907]|nr:lysozyme [Synechococcus sp. RS9907]